MEFKRAFLIFILLACGIFLLPSFSTAQKVQRVVIDAGHGGHDPGAVGKISKEKDIVLAIALKTGKLINENMKDVEVIYTRKTDVFVELHRRARIANEAKADLFISIHCNANKSTTPYGSETYVMGLHRSDANLAVAQLENASILLEDDYHVQYEGFDPKSPEGFIFFSMLQNAYLDQSLYLASGVQKYFRDVVNFYDRGVKQAGFLVLYKTTMPSVLIEAGFISNANEEKLLASEQGQNNIAKSIYNAVRDYKLSVEKGNKSFPLAENILTKDISDYSTASQEQVNQSVENNNTTVAEKSQNASGLVFRVQFMISKTMIATSAKQFKDIPSVNYYLHQGMYKYTAGNESSFDKALKVRAEMVRRGYKDAFVVAFLNGERIDLNKAREMSMK
ncbi:MAG: N-acetylmuramoyl-L-alanine amidase [Bacteroidetes bacterium HGW-Bacteroidetes-11]|jgi:N-acetylmuramoyl-L-alanine amidase|nr:MAG: N-acetylmuramoyl-L-alanine amidase [Bacteroidetes bacterium HGW-Bacteroidetes-11]